MRPSDPLTHWIRTARSKVRGPTARLSAAQALAAVQQFVRIERGDSAGDGLLEEVAMTKGFALVVNQAAYEALARSSPLAVVKAIYDFLLPFAMELEDFHAPVDTSQVLESDCIKVNIAVLRAIADDKPPPFDPDWVGEGPDPASWLREALEFAVYASRYSDRPRAFSYYLGNHLVTVTRNIIAGRGVGAAQRLVAAFDTVGRERVADASTDVKQERARSLSGTPSLRC